MRQIFSPSIMVLLVLALSACGSLGRPKITTPPAVSTAATAAKLNQLQQTLQERGIVDDQVNDLAARAHSKADELASLLAQLQAEADRVNGVQIDALTRPMK